MSKLVRGLVLVAAMAVVSVVALSVAEAQDKGKKAAGATTGIVEVKEGKDSKYRLTIRDTNNKFLAISAAYATKEDAMKGLEKLKSALENPKITSNKSAKAKE